MLVGLMVAAALPPSPGAAAEAIYRWRDDSGQLHFSNDPERVPNGAAQVVPAETTSRRSRLGGAPASAASSDRPDHTPGPPIGGCAPPDPSSLIDAITSRLASRASTSAAKSGLTLFVSGTAVWHDSSAVVQTLPGGTSDDAEGEADEAAIAFPASGACPSTPPLERYGTATPSRGAAEEAPSICGDFHRASAEIFAALSRNEAVTRTFDMAAARYESLAAGGERSRVVSLPPWLVQVQAAQAAELAAETEEFVDELAVALDEIDAAARARGCW